MKVTITRACGHEETIEVYGTNVHGERDRKIEYEKTLVCKACYEQQTAAENKAAGMTELTGTPKQIAWAEKIRADIIGKIDNMPAQNEQYEQIKSQVLATLKSIDSASWWIDRRGASVGAIVREVVKR